MTTTYHYFEHPIALGEGVHLASNKAKKAGKSKDHPVLVMLTLRV